MPYDTIFLIVFLRIVMYVVQRLSHNCTCVVYIIYIYKNILHTGWNIILFRASLYFIE